MREKLNKYLPFLLLLLIAMALLFPVVFTGADSFFIKQDNLHQAFPWYNKLAIALHKGYWPVWDANTFCGKNFAGEAQAGIFYPINILWCLLFGTAHGISTSYLDLLVAVHYLICLVGMYRLARVLQLSVTASLGTALVFAFAGPVGARAAGQTCIFFGLALVPWSIYFIVRYYLKDRKRINFIFAGLVVGLQILAGHIQPCFHTLIIGLFFILFFEIRGRKNFGRPLLAIILNTLLILAFAMLIALPQIYYTVQYMSQSYRAVSGGIYIGPGQKVPLYIFSHWHMIHLSDLLNFVGQRYSPPDDDNIIYMGVLTLSLAIFYLVSFWKRAVTQNHITLTFTLIVIMGVGLLCALGYLTPVYRVLYAIPFATLVRQLGRYIIMVSFGVALMAGLMINYVSELAAKVKSYLFSAIVGAVFVILCLTQTDISWSVTIPFLLTFVFFLNLPEYRNSRYLGVVTLGVIIADLALNPVDFLPARIYFYPDSFYGRNRIIDSLESSYGRYRVAFAIKNNRLERRNVGDVYAIQTKYGYGATVNQKFADFINFDQGVNSEINDLLNIKYIITDSTLDSNFIFKDSVEGLMLYEKINFYPRCYWKRQLGDSGVNIEESNKATVKELDYSDLYQKWLIECPISDTLVFSENMYLGWRCYDNGREIPIFSSRIKNYPPLFRMIDLAGGRHLIEFKFQRIFFWF